LTPGTRIPFLQDRAARGDPQCYRTLIIGEKKRAYRRARFSHGGAQRALP